MEPLENSSGERRFPAPRGTGEQDGGSIWAEDDCFIARMPDEDGMPAQGCGLKRMQVVRDQRLDHFADARAGTTLGHVISALLDGIQRVGDRNAAFAH